MVSYIFQAAAESGKIGEMVKNRLEVESLMLKRAANLVLEFIEREGSLESEKLGKICVYWSIKETTRSSAGRMPSKT